MNGCFLIQCAKSLSGSDSFYSSFELMLQMQVAVQCNDRWGRSCPIIPFLFATFIHLHIDGRAQGISENVFLKLMKEKEFRVQFLLRFVGSYSKAQALGMLLKTFWY